MTIQTVNFHTFVLDYIKQFENTWAYYEFDIPEIFLYNWSWNNAEELFLVWFDYLQNNLLWDHQMSASKLSVIGKHSKHRRIMSALRWSYKLEELYTKESIHEKPND